MADAVDVVVVGGGVAGAALALMLGRAGLRVDLLESARFPREIACGEGLMPGGVGVLARLGLLEAVGGVAIPAVRYHGFGTTAWAPFPVTPGVAPGHALGQRRVHLDKALFAAARATPGVRAVEGARVRGVIVEAGRAVGVEVDGTSVRAALVVGADGRHSTVRRRLGLDGPRRPHARRLGVRRHFRLAAGQPRPDAIDVFLGQGHELYVTPLPDGELLVAALSDQIVPGRELDATYARWIAAQPELRRRLEGAWPVTELEGRSPLAHRARAAIWPGAVLLGDAARVTDPLTAGGMAQALLSAELLAAHVPRVLAEGDAWLRRFDRRRRALLRHGGWLTAILLFLVARPALARRLLGVMRARPSLMTHLIGVAGGVRRLL